MVHLRANKSACGDRSRVMWLLVVFCFLLVLLGSERLLAADATEFYLTTMYSRDWSTCMENLGVGTVLPEDSQLNKAKEDYRAAMHQAYNYFTIFMDDDDLRDAMRRQPFLLDIALYRCSGLILRGTRQEMPTGQYAWEPYPEGRTSDTSFSYLRADIKLKRLAWSYTNGFIIDPTSALKFDCFYPLDGSSDNRADKGCGAHIEAPSVNPQCPDNAVMTGDVPLSQRCRNAAAMTCVRRMAPSSSISVSLRRPRHRRPRTFPMT